MKNILTIQKGFALLLIALLAYSPTFAQSGVNEFNVDGIKVILKNSPKEVISVSLFVEGGVTNYAKELEGIESVSFDYALTGGTKSMDKSTFSAAAEKIGTRFSHNSTYDYGTLDMTCVKMFWNDSWNLFADAILNPAFDEKEYLLLREKSISIAENNASDPDNHLRNIAMKSAFSGTSYETIPSGTLESIANLTRQQVVDYYKRVMGKKQIFVVVVGNVTEADLRSKIQSSLAKLPEGNATNYEERHIITDGGAYIEDRDIATNYIRGLMSAPTVDTEEGIAMWTGMSILRDRFFLEIRTKRSLSYAPGAFYSTGVLKNPYNGLYVSTVDPKQSMEVMIDEINKIKEQGFEERELRNEKQTFLTRHLMGQETTSAQANSLGTFEIVGGWEMAESFTERVNALTLKQLNAVFDKYTNAIQWTYLGKEDMVEPENFLQPEGTLEIINKKD